MSRLSRWPGVALSIRMRLIVEQFIFFFLYSLTYCLLGVADVHRLQRGDAFDIGLVELHRYAERDGAHDGGLVGRVHAFDVERGVGLGITQRLRLLQHDAEVQALAAHLAQDEVGGAVDDAGHPVDAVGGEAFAQRLDDGDAAGHRGLEGHDHALGARGGEDLGTVHRQQSLVRRDHMLAGSDGLQHQGLGDAVAADEFDDDRDVGVGDDGAGVVHHLHVRADDGAGALGVEVGHHGDGDAAAGAALDLFLVALQHLVRAAAHRADAEQAYLDSFHAECRLR